MRLKEKQKFGSVSEILQRVVLSPFKEKEHFLVNRALSALAVMTEGIKTHIFQETALKILEE